MQLHLLISFNCYLPYRALHSFPTRRSSDLFAPLSPVSRPRLQLEVIEDGRAGSAPQLIRAGAHLDPHRRDRKLDRKSTRLNSSHVSISYAVFCLKKKNHIDTNTENYIISKQ